MYFTINDFKVGQRIDTPAKIQLWNNILKRTFGGLDCAMRQYEKYSSTGNWQSYKINGMITYLDELTGGKYGRKDDQIQRVAGTLATQFKKKFPSIHYLMFNSLGNTALLDREFNINPSKGKVSTEKNKIEINYSKCYSILGDIYSKNISEEEAKFISQQMLLPYEKNN